MFVMYLNCKILQIQKGTFLNLSQPHAPWDQIIFVIIWE